MTVLTLQKAQAIVAEVLRESRARNFNIISVAVLDGRGALVAAATEDGASPLRWRIAVGKANGAVALGVGSRKLGVMAQERPHFVNAAGELASGGLVPVAGGVLIRAADRTVLGAVGVSGDTSDNDEAVAVKAIEAAGFIADGG